MRNRRSNPLGPLWDGCIEVGGNARGRRLWEGDTLDEALAAWERAKGDHPNEVIILCQTASVVRRSNER